MPLGIRWMFRVAAIEAITSREITNQDVLQVVIQRLKQEELPVALQFTNYR